MLRVLPPQGNRFCSKWRNHRVRRGVTPSLPIRSQYSRTLEQPSLLQDRFERDCRGKTRKIAFRVVLRQFFETSFTVLMPSVLPLVSGMRSRDGSIYVSGKLPTYPSPKPSFCPKWEVSVYVSLDSPCTDAPSPKKMFFLMGGGASISILIKNAIDLENSFFFNRNGLF